MKKIAININECPVTVKVSKWTKRPGVNGIYVIADRESISFIKECLELALNIEINTYVNGMNGFGIHIPDHIDSRLNEDTIIRCLLNTNLK